MAPDCRIEQLRSAHAQWQVPASNLGTARLAAPPLLTNKQAAALIAQAEQLLQNGPRPNSERCDSALIVTKAPHAGSDATVAAIIARCLAFGLVIERVVRKEAADAESIAHALYPDVWLHFARLPSGQGDWRRLEQRFNNDQYLTLFGERYRRDAVVVARQACADNNLSYEDLMRIWQTGREPLRRDDAVTTYGSLTADLICGDSDEYVWYRGAFPIGIQKITSGTLAFALRHPKLYGGRPVILLNGHFALLYQRFHSPGGRGATIVEVGLDSQPSVREFRHRFIGSADVPGECLPGTIRRDAQDGVFQTDAPLTPVTAWANVVHASDGYLAGAIETTALLDSPRKPRLYQTLLDAGYVEPEIANLIMSNPVVVAHGDDRRLTKRTAGKSRADCLAIIQQHFPPLSSFGYSSPSAYPLFVLLNGQRLDLSRRSSMIDQPHPEPNSRLPLRSVPDSAALPKALHDEGNALLNRGGVGMLVPLAGAGGRFGGYHVPEGDSARLKPLLPLFSIGGLNLSSLDVRAAHARHIAAQSGFTVPLLLSCSHLTEQHARRWLETNPNTEAEIARVPEMYRLRVAAIDTTNCGAPDATAADNIVRDVEGSPLLKPSGSLGLLIAASISGTLDRWEQRGIEVAVAANSDDVGFRLDRAILGMFADSDLDAVVLTTPILQRASRTPSAWFTPEKGGLLRERPSADTWSAYIEEHAVPAIHSNERISTNQIYLRLRSLRRIVPATGADGWESVRKALPLYFEIKQVKLEDRDASALHAYQVYGDILRILPRVVALHMTREPRPQQRRGYAPLKSPDDIERGQSLLDQIAFLGDELSPLAT